MTVDQSPEGQHPPVNSVDDHLNDEDERIFRIWHESLVLQDPRYNHKGIGVLARVAMTNEDLRYRLINDTANFLDELRSKLDLPEDVTLKFYDNSQESLNVVLPPRSGEMSKRPVKLREALRSRTTQSPFAIDDFNHGDIWFEDGENEGDPHTHDG